MSAEEIPLTDERRQKVDAFKMLCLGNDVTALYYLEQTEWDSTEAMRLYYDKGCSPAPSSYVYKEEDDNASDGSLTRKLSSMLFDPAAAATASTAAPSLMLKQLNSAFEHIFAPDVLKRMLKHCAFQTDRAAGLLHEVLRARSGALPPQKASICFRSELTLPVVVGPDVYPILCDSDTPVSLLLSDAIRIFVEKHEDDPGVIGLYNISRGRNVDLSDDIGDCAAQGDILFTTGYTLKSTEKTRCTPTVAAFVENEERARRHSVQQQAILEQRKQEDQRIAPLNTAGHSPDSNNGYAALANGGGDSNGDTDMGASPDFKLATPMAQMWAQRRKERKKRRNQKQGHQNPASGEGGGADDDMLVFLPKSTTQEQRESTAPEENAENVQSAGPATRSGPTTSSSCIASPMENVNTNTYYQVHESGDARAVGEYFKVRKHLGAPLYTNAQGIILCRAVIRGQSGWVLQVGTGADAERLYGVSSAAKRPPCTGWRSMIGARPAPTLLKTRPKVHNAKRKSKKNNKGRKDAPHQDDGDGSRANIDNSAPPVVAVGPLEEKISFRPGPGSSKRADEDRLVLLHQLEFAFERFLPGHTPDDLDAYIEKFESLAAVHDHMRMGHGVDLDSMEGLPEFDIRVARFKARERKRRRQKIEQQQLDEELKHKQEKKAKAKARRERKRRQRQEELERRWRSRQEGRDAYQG